MRRGKFVTPGKIFITVLVAFAFALYPLASIGQTPQAPQKPGEEKLKPAPHKPVGPRPHVPTKTFKKPAPHKPVGPRPGVPMKILKKPAPPKPGAEQQKQ